MASFSENRGFYGGAWRRDRERGTIQGAASGGREKPQNEETTTGEGLSGRTKN